MIYVNGPETIIHVGACGGPDGTGPGWPVILRANDSCPDLNDVANARLWVRRPFGSTPEVVTWTLNFPTAEECEEIGLPTPSALVRPAYYKFKGVNVAQDPPDLPVPGKYIGFVQVDFGNGIWVRFSDDMCLTVSSNP